MKSDGHVSRLPNLERDVLKEDLLRPRYRYRHADRVGDLSTKIEAYVKRFIIESTSGSHG